MPNQKGAIMGDGSLHLWLPFKYHCSSGSVVLFFFNFIRSNRNFSSELGITAPTSGKLGIAILCGVAQCDSRCIYFEIRAASISKIPPNNQTVIVRCSSYCATEDKYPCQW
jgi:hypothetical protein